MAKLSKQVQKDVKKISKQLFNKNGLTLKRTYDISTSFFANQKENKPYVTVTAHGDYKISVMKLIVILLCALSGFTLIFLCIREIRDNIKVRKRRARDEERYYHSAPKDEEIPF